MFKITSLLLCTHLQMFNLNFEGFRKCHHFVCWLVWRVLNFKVKLSQIIFFQTQNFKQQELWKNKEVFVLFNILPRYEWPSFLLSFVVRKKMQVMLTLKAIQTFKESDHKSNIISVESFSYLRFPSYLFEKLPVVNLICDKSLPN